MCDFVSDSLRGSKPRCTSWCYLKQANSSRVKDQMQWTNAMQWVVAEHAVGSDRAQRMHAMQPSPPSKFLMMNPVYVSCMIPNNEPLRYSKEAHYSPCHWLGDCPNRTPNRQLIQDCTRPSRKHMFHERTNKCMNGRTNAQTNKEAGGW